MQRTYTLLLFILVLLNTQSCDLLFGQEDEFTCEKNAPVKVNDVDKCAFARGDNYYFSENPAVERITIGFSYGGGSFDVALYTTEIVEGTTYNYPGDASLSFAELNKGGSGTLTITSFDRVSRTISGKFDMSAEGAANYTPYTYKVKGTFNEVSF